MNEIWKEFNGYQISNFGNVRNKKDNSPKTIALNSCNYQFVCLYYLPKPKLHFVHRLVAFLFIENPENKPCVNHIDGNKLNNNVSNLEWCTHKENTKHAIDTGLLGFKYGEDNNSAKLTNNQVKEIYDRLSKGERNLDIANSFGLSPDHISKLKTGNYFLQVPKPEFPKTIKEKILLKKDEILPKIKEGKSWLSLQKEFGFCRKLIKKYLHDDIV